MLRRLPPPPKRQRSLAALRALLLAACALLLLVKTSTTLARALARAFAPSAHLASAPRRAPRHLFTPPTAAMAPMKLLAVRTAKRTYPTGDPSFAVKQAFPAGALLRAAAAPRKCLRVGTAQRCVPWCSPPLVDSIPRSPVLTRLACGAQA